MLMEYARQRDTGDPEPIGSLAELKVEHVDDVPTEDRSVF